MLQLLLKFNDNVRHLMVVPLQTAGCCASRRVPSGASHYRQVNLRLSQIYLRISQNKRIKDFLVNSLTNVHVSQLREVLTQEPEDPGQFY
ncbi:unnamed protein product [Gongylonema pulchrum]|uniref:SOCS box domain-containing protein n=1 Tax=Gongylonema pulchrum TaxID=637853 RepID=A0A183DUP4_9BILA|nr:unnamed protein product [Gongylonema pulchrum]